MRVHRSEWRLPFTPTVEPARSSGASCRAQDSKAQLHLGLAIVVYTNQPLLRGSPAENAVQRVYVRIYGSGQPKKWSCTLYTSVSILCTQQLDVIDTQMCRQERT